MTKKVIQIRIGEKEHILLTKVKSEIYEKTGCKMDYKDVIKYLYNVWANSPDKKMKIEPEEVDNKNKKFSEILYLDEEAYEKFKKVREYYNTTNNNTVRILVKMYENRNI